MKKLVPVLLCCFICCGLLGQKRSIQQIKTELQRSVNPLAYVRDTLKKKYKLDTIYISRIHGYAGIADSLAYHGKVRKVYGPYDNGKFLVQLLAQLPNTYYHIGQIYLDTTVFSRKFADSLANNIIERIRKGESTFEELSRTYSMGGEGLTGGDLGWIAKGILIPEIESAILKHKKGDIFKVWTRAGVHIVRKIDNQKQDKGVALMMRVFL